MKIIDGLLGRVLTMSLPTHAVQAMPAPPHSILIIRPGGIGDAALLVPAIRHLRQVLPDVQITILAERRNAAVFNLIPGIARVLCYDRPADLLSTLSTSYNLVIDTEQWHRLSAVVARFIRAPITIGFATNERRRMFTHTVPYSHDDYEAESFLRLLEPLGLATPADREPPFLIIPETVAIRTRDLLTPLCGRPYLVIFPGASIAERHWGAENYREVALKLAAATGLKIVVAGGTVDQAEAAVIAGTQGVSLAGKTSLVETAALIAEAQLLISADSGLLHIAVGLGVPTLSLFGPGIAAKWAPRGERHRAINHQLPCSPCTRFGTTPPCPNDVRCMQEITPTEVFETALQLLTLNLEICNDVTQTFLLERKIC